MILHNNVQQQDNILKNLKILKINNILFKILLIIISKKEIKMHFLLYYLYNVIKIVKKLIFL